jgi:hypothetical protein
MLTEARVLMSDKLIAKLFGGRISAVMHSMIKHLA